MNASAGERATIAAHPVGTLAFDWERLAPELEILEKSAVQPCRGYAHGTWGKCLLLRRTEAHAVARPTADGARVPYLVERLLATFRIEHIAVAQVFAAAKGGFVRPHVDWLARAPIFTRLHVPLQTDDAALSSESDVLFRMGAGEIWYLDSSRPHSGGAFGNRVRLHAIVDLDPSVDVREAFVDPNAYAPRDARASFVERPELEAHDLAALLGLAELATEANLEYVLDVLAAVHFRYRVDCAETYDWLDEIARRTKDAAIVARARALRRMYLTPFG